MQLRLKGVLCHEVDFLGARGGHRWIGRSGRRPSAGLRHLQRVRQSVWSGRRAVRFAARLHPGARLLSGSSPLLRQRLGRLLRTSCEGRGGLGPVRHRRLFAHTALPFCAGMHVVVPLFGFDPDVEADARGFVRCSAGPNASASFSAKEERPQRRNVQTTIATCFGRDGLQLQKGRRTASAVNRAGRYLPALFANSLLSNPPRPFLPAAPAASTGSSPDKALDNAMIDCVMAAFGACSISGTPLFRASIIVR